MVELQARLTSERSLTLLLVADERAVALVRHVVRALGHGPPDDAFADIELAVAEACTNVVRHAYSEPPGPMEVVFEPSAADLSVVVRDHGTGLPAPVEDLFGRGLGLSVMDSVASRLEVRDGDWGGTLVAMAFPWSARPGGARLDGDSWPGIDRILRAMVGTRAVQLDMEMERLADALLASELLASRLVEQLSGDCLHIQVKHQSAELEMRVGPLGPGGAERLLRETEIPGLGNLLPALADEVTVDPAPDSNPPGAQYLRVRIGARTRSRREAPSGS